MIIRRAQEKDLPSFLGLAAQVEHWFGPMVDDPGFHRALTEHIHRSAALVATPARPEAGPDAPRDAESGAGPGPGVDLLGGLLFGGQAPTYHVHWLVVSAQARGGGVGQALMAEAVRRFGREPGHIEVVTFGADHPGAVTSGARVFYERLGFTPAEPAEPGPEGGSRQVYRRAVN
ncbi:GNAT family N-acetyltransferase [Streptomyces sp. NPDC057702]|uniref:GNAT family N-acetyltransferase n=1 Tax=unclassified Streptomyces TaxID=2593676 RepID=UPI00369F02EF